MNIHFKPKIIIGSLIGFITTILGIAAAFFPGFFNLEKDKIYEYSTTLRSTADYGKFVDFLLSHEGKIIGLNLTYFEDERYEYKAGVPIKINIKDVKDREGTYLYSTVGKGGYILVGSDYSIKSKPTKNFYRANGGFGIWLPGPTMNGDDDRYYLVDISGDSGRNRIYKWNLGKNEEMILQGHFLVKKPVLVDAYKETRAQMPQQWLYAFCGMDDMYCPPLNVIELVPISRKELELRKY